MDQHSHSCCEKQRHNIEEYILNKKCNDGYYAVGDAVYIYQNEDLLIQMTC